MNPTVTSEFTKKGEKIVVHLAVIGDSEGMPATKGTQIDFSAGSRYR
jgi:hypothetical protein